MSVNISMTKQCKNACWIGIKWSKTKRNKTKRKIKEWRWWFTSLFHYFSAIQKWNEIGYGIKNKNEEETNTYSHSQTMRANVHNCIDARARVQRKVFANATTNKQKKEKKIKKKKLWNEEKKFLNVWWMNDLQRHKWRVLHTAKTQLAIFFHFSSHFSLSLSHYYYYYDYYHLHCMSLKEMQKRNFLSLPVCVCVC